MAERAKLHEITTAVRNGIQNLKSYVFLAKRVIPRTECCLDGYTVNLHV